MPTTMRVIAVLAAAAFLLGCGKETKPVPKVAPPAPAALLGPPPPVPSQDAFLKLGLALDEERQELVVTVTNVGSKDVSVSRDQLSLGIDALAGDPPTELVGLPKVVPPSPSENVARGAQVSWRLSCRGGDIPVTANAGGFHLGRGRYSLRAVLRRDKASVNPGFGPEEWFGHLESAGLTVDTRSGTVREVKPDAVLL